MTLVCTSELLMFMNWEKYAFNLNESKWFPTPMTLLFLNPDALSAIVVITSTGLVATNMIESGEYSAIFLE